MNKTNTAAALVLLVASGQVNAAKDYSIGFRVGELVKFSIKGVRKKSGEGQLMMGNESNLYFNTGSEGGRGTMVNPWKFSSTDKAMQDSLDAQLGQYVVLGYTQETIKGFDTDTDYQITSIESIAAPREEGCSTDKYKRGEFSRGKRAGRIVKASLKGHKNKTYEF